jgi:pyruvate dehydrogenase E2 component (dihydrolipoamide acetyltransferase)
MAEVTMPRLSDSMEEGVIIRWLVADGETVGKGDELIEVETDKATTVYEAEAEGLLKIAVEEGETVAVGAVIATIGDAAEAAATATAAPAASASAAAGDPEANGTATAVAVPLKEGRVRATPVARKIAREAGLELAGVAGTGPAGRIRKADVEAAIAAGGTAAPAPAAPSPAAPAPASVPAVVEERPVETAKGAVSVEELSRLQQTIVRRMSESRATVPDFSLESEVDFSAALALRARLREHADPAPSVNDLIVKACGVALRRHPHVNGSYVDGQVNLYERINIGVAVASDSGLVVPTVFDADRKGLGEIATDVRRMAAAVRDRSITANQLSGGTFTISNLGMFGIAAFTAVINPPQAAILAVGASRGVPAVRDGELVEIPTVRLTLCCDHRILDGAAGAAFLATLKEILEDPERMLL